MATKRTSRAKPTKTTDGAGNLCSPSTCCGENDICLDCYRREEYMEERREAYLDKLYGEDRCKNGRRQV